MQSIKKFKEQIQNANTIAIIGHVMPDADALASMVALLKIINNNFNENEKVIHLFAENFSSCEMYDPIVKDKHINDEKLDYYDLAISVDSPVLSRLGCYAEIFNSSKNKIVIDHHQASENFGDLNYVYKCSSTCELVFILAKALNIELSTDILKLIYAGIVTDTVNLTQGTVRISSYKIIAEIVEKVSDLSSLNSIKDHFLSNKTKNNAQLLERALHSMRFYLNDRVSIMKITKADFIETNATNEDTLGIVNNAISIKGVYIAILFIKQEDGSYYVSVRGKNGVPVVDIATFFGGGGHESVCAFSYNGKLSEIKPDLLQKCEKALLETSTNDNDDALFDD